MANPIEPDPHGIAEVFANRLKSNLELMGPKAATKEAMQTVTEYLEASEFIDMRHKGSIKPEYVRVWKKPKKIER